MTRKPRPTMAALLLALSASHAGAQSSSLYLDNGAQSFAERYGLGEPDPAVRRSPGPTVNPAVARLNLAVVQRAEPRSFALHDVITIIVREDFEASADATLETEKDASIEGEIAAFPRLTLADLVDAQLRNNTSLADTPIELDASMSREYTGEGAAERRDTMTGRVSAQVIDVKPNGLLVLMATKTIRQDDEQVTILATGTCRPEDVSAVDNAVLSSHIANLQISQTTSGALRRAAEKGLFTRAMEVLFPF
ncbi:MAG: flagellar basal body L-ring protein FlgH [Planctomycetota bacterium]